MKQDLTLPEKRNMLFFLFCMIQFRNQDCGLDSNTWIRLANLCHVVGMEQIDRFMRTAESMNKREIV